MQEKKKYDKLDLMKKQLLKFFICLKTIMIEKSRVKWQSSFSY